MYITHSTHLNVQNPKGTAIESILVFSDCFRDQDCLNWESVLDRNNQSPLQIVNIKNNWKWIPSNTNSLLLNDLSLAMSVTKNINGLKLDGGWDEWGEDGECMVQCRGETQPLASCQNQPLVTGHCYWDNVLLSSAEDWPHTQVQKVYGWMSGRQICILFYVYGYSPEQHFCDCHLLLFNVFYCVEKHQTTSFPLSEDCGHQQSFWWIS